MITRLAVFDFDGTLFRSPEKPVWWPWQGFWGRPESLSPPYVPETPGPDWWAESVVVAARGALTDPETYAIVLTGRPEKLSRRVEGLLRSAGLNFPGVFCVGNGAGNTLDMKLQCIRQVAARLPDLQHIEMWDDRPEHIPPFRTFLQDMGFTFETHLVARATREFDHIPEGAPT